MSQNTTNTSSTRSSQRPSIEDIFDQVIAEAPALADHLRLDRSWVWYCGPSLKDDAKHRAILRKLGFRFARGGHVTPTGETGTWGHSCQKPMRRKRGGGSGARRPAATTTVHTSAAPAPVRYRKPDEDSLTGQLELLTI